MTLPASAAALVLAPELIDLLLGAGWTDAVAPFQVLTLGMLFRTGHRLSDATIRASGAVYRSAWRQACYAALVVGGVWIGQHWGLVGAASAVLIAMALHFLLMAQLSLKLASLTWSSFAMAHVPGLALGVLVWGQVEFISVTLRTWELPSSLVLAASLVAIAPTLILVRCLPRLFLGADGRWMLQALLQYTAERLPGSLRGRICLLEETGPREKKPETAS